MLEKSEPRYKSRCVYFWGPHKCCPLLLPLKETQSSFAGHERWSILCSLQGKSTPRQEEGQFLLGKKPTLRVSTVGSGRDWTVRFSSPPRLHHEMSNLARERERNTHKAELLKNPRWETGVWHRPCGLRAKWIGQTTCHTRSGMALLCLSLPSCEMGW